MRSCIFFKMADHYWRWHSTRRETTAVFFKMAGIEKQFVQLQLARLLRIPDTRSYHGSSGEMRTVLGSSSLRFIYAPNPLNDVMPKPLDWLSQPIDSMSTILPNQSCWLNPPSQLTYYFNSLLKPILIIPLEPNPVTGFLNYFLDFLDDIAHLTLTTTDRKQPRS